MKIIINFYALFAQTCVFWPRKQTSVLLYNAQSFLVQMFILTYVSYTRYIMVLNIILQLFLLYKLPFSDHAKYNPNVPDYWKSTVFGILMIAR